MTPLEEFMQSMSNRPTSASRSREFDHKAAPQSNAVSDGLTQWMQGVKERTLHPLEAMAKYSQNFQNMPPVDQGMQLIGGGMAGTFIGKGAKTWDVLKAQQANELLAKGIDPREVWKQTGTMRGVDNALRQEIPDNLARLKITGDWSGRADMAYKHNDLYAAYPEMAGTSMRLDPEINGGSLFEIGGKNHITVGSKQGNTAAKSTTGHELQHVIQQREGWAKGGSPEGMAQEYGLARSRLHFLEQEPDYIEGSKQIDNLWNQAFSGNTMDEAAIAAKEAEIIQQYPSLAESKKVMGTLRQTDEYGFDSYKNLAGEAEARLTQSRMNMTGAERAASYPPDMFDVPMNQQIVRMGDNGTALQTANKGLLLDAVDKYKGFNVVGGTKEFAVGQTAIKLKDGTVLTDNSPIHAVQINKLKNLGIPVGDIESGGFIRADGSYITGSADTPRIIEQDRARQAILKSRAARDGQK